jgi:purine-binding chemotaxis protein CheW
MLDNEHANKSTAVEAFEFITLSVGGQWFCVPTRLIQEIRQWSPVTYLPGSSDVVYGAINLRGTVLPIVDLAAVLGLERQSPTERNAVVVTKCGSKMGGYLVSNASKLIKVASDEIQPPPDIDEQSTSKFCSGTLFIEDQMIQILAIEKLFPFGDESDAE